MSYQFDSVHHAHTLEGQPLIGCSTVVKEVMPPFLAKWGAQCAVDYIKANMGSDASVSNELLSEAVLAWSKVRKDAAEKGTDMHSTLENYVSACITKDTIAEVAGDAQDAKLIAYAKWSRENVEEFILAEKNTYSRELWTGGIVDCVATLKSGKIAIIDFKSSKEAYFNHFVQVAGYALMIQETGYGNSDGSRWQNPLKIDELIVVPFGGKKLTPVTVQNVEGMIETFRQTVGVYKMLQTFKNR